MLTITTNEVNTIKSRLAKGEKSNYAADGKITSCIVIGNKGEFGVVLSSGEYVRIPFTVS